MSSAYIGLTSFAYYTTSPDPNDKVVSMGGVQPDTGRNTNGLRPAISLLLEVGGVGFGRAHLLRRVHTAVIAGITVAQVAAEQGNVRLVACDQVTAGPWAHALNIERYRRPPFHFNRLVGTCHRIDEHELLLCAAVPGSHDELPLTGLRRRIGLGAAHRRLIDFACSACE
jgi:hypothetical protein